MISRSVHCSVIIPTPGVDVIYPHGVIIPTPGPVYSTHTPSPPTSPHLLAMFRGEIIDGLENGVTNVEKAAGGYLSFADDVPVGSCVSVSKTSAIIKGAFLGREPQGKSNT